MAKAQTSQPASPGNNVSELSTTLDPVYSRMLALAKVKEGTAFISRPCDDDFKGKYPNLFEWLCALQIPGEYQKDAARISLACAGGAWEISLSDSALEHSLSYTANTFTESLARLEAGITDPEAPWRKWSRGKKGLKKFTQDQNKL